MKMFVDVPASELPEVLSHFDSLAELATALGLTPQALYVRRRKDKHLVTGAEALRLYVSHGIQPCVSRPDLIDFRIRRA